MNFRLVFGAAITTAAAMLVSAGAQAQSDYPTEPIRWIIPWNPGGTNDIVARVLQPDLEKEGINVVVENVPGGGSAVGMGQLATSKPDGYTLGSGTTSILTLMAQKTVPLKNDQFDPLIRISVDPVILVTSSKTQHDTLQKFMDHMKESTQKISIGTPGSRNVNHIFAATTAKVLDKSFKHVSYSGGSRVVAALLGGHIDAAVLKPSETMELINNGDLIALGAYSNERIDALPDTPTFKELGYDVFPYGPVVQMAYLAGPHGLSPEVKDRLITAFDKVLTTDSFKEFADKNGFEISPLSGQSLEEEINKVTEAVTQVAENMFPKR